MRNQRSADKVPSESGGTEGRPITKDDTEDAPIESYIQIVDLSPQGIILWTSPSIKECLGWEPEELAGKSCYVVLHPDEIETVRKVSMVNIKKETVAGLIQIRAKHKDERVGEGGWVNMECLVNLCFDCCVIVGGRRGFDLRREAAWRTSAEDVVRVDRQGNLNLEKWNNRNAWMIDVLQQEFHWDSSLPQQEPRTCLILNRYTIFASVLFATKTSSTMLESEPDELKGRSFYDLIEEAAEIRDQIDMVRSTDSITHLHFTWVAPTTKRRLRCEAVATIAWDGMILIVRRRKDDVVEATRSWLQGGLKLGDAAEGGVEEKQMDHAAETTRPDDTRGAPSPRRSSRLQKNAANVQD